MDGRRIQSWWDCTSTFDKEKLIKSYYGSDTSIEDITTRMIFELYQWCLHEDQKLF